MSYITMLQKAACQRGLCTFVVVIFLGGGYVCGPFLGILILRPEKEFQTLGVPWPLLISWTTFVSFVKMK